MAWDPESFSGRPEAMDSFEPALASRRRLTCSKAELADAAKFKEERNGWMAPANFLLGAASGIHWNTISATNRCASMCACAASHCISLEILAAIPREAQIWPSVCDHSALQDLQGLWPGLHEDVALDEGSSHYFPLGLIVVGFLTRTFSCRSYLQVAAMLCKVQKVQKSWNPWEQLQRR
jgi:hypothetical protein